LETFKTPLFRHSGQSKRNPYPSKQPKTIADKNKKIPQKDIPLWDLFIG